MSYKAIVYFNGPMTKWQQGRPHPEEVVAEIVSRWRWYAKARAQSLVNLLNRNHCAYVMEGDIRMQSNFDARGASPDLVQLLPAILKRNNEALEKKIVDGLKRRT